MKQVFEHPFNQVTVVYENSFGGNIATINVVFILLLLPVIAFEVQKETGLLG